MERKSIGNRVDHQPLPTPAGSQQTISNLVRWKILGKVIAGYIPLFLILQLGPDLFRPYLGQTGAVLVSAAIMLGSAAGLEIWFFKRQPLQALRQLGFGRPGGRAIIVALILSGVMLLFFPILSLVSGVRLHLNADWLATLAGIIVFNGLAEETLFRGYVFSNLRQSNSFFRAGLISLVLFAGAHLYLFVRNPFAIAFAATLVAVSATFPLAYLFEHGGSTLWAPVIFHSATHMIRLVSIPEPLYVPALVAWLGMQIFLPLTVFGFHKYLKNVNSG